VGVAVLLYLPSLGARQVATNDEARYLLIEDSRILPTRDALTTSSTVYLWLLAAVERTGGLTEFSARLPSALAGIGGILMTYVLGRRLFGAEAGLLSALLLATSPGYFWNTRTISPDLISTFFIVLAFLAFDLRRRKPVSHAQLLLFSCSLALAISLVGLLGVFPLLTLLLYLALRRELAMVKDVGWRWGLVVGGAVAGGVATSILLTTAISEEIVSPPHSLVFYGKTLFTGLFPWSLLFPSALVVGVKAIKDRGVTSPVLHPLLWSLVLLTLLPLATAPRSGSLLPLYPALALVVGWAWEAVGSGDFGRAWPLTLQIPVTALSVVIAFFGLTLASGGGVPVPGPTAPFLSGESTGAFLLGLTAVAAGLLSLLFLLRGRRRLSLLVVALLMIPTIRGIEGAWLSRNSQPYELSALTKVVKGLLNASQPVAVVDREEPLVSLYVGQKLPVIKGEEKFRRPLSSAPTSLLVREENLSRFGSNVSQRPWLLGKATIEGSPLLLTSQSPLTTGTCEVVVVSVDGLRADAIGRVHTPVLSRLARQGAFAPHAETVRVTKTLPAHVAMLTGLGPGKSRVFHDAWRSGEPQFGGTTVFEVVREAGLGTAMFSGKGKFGYLGKPATIDHLDVGEKSDAEVMTSALDYLSESRPAFTFIHLPDTDEAGHRHGWMTPAQSAVIEKVDQLIGQLVDRLTSAPRRAPFLLIVTADHGGEGKVHFRRWFFWPTWRTAFNVVPWIAWGETVKPGVEISGQVWAYDTASTVLYALGLGSPLGWDGRPLTEIFVAPPWTAPGSPVRCRPG